MGSTGDKPPAPQEALLPADDLPEVGVSWSKKRLIVTLIITVIISALAVFGFLFYQEYKKTGLFDSPLPKRVFKSYDKIYSNDSWGFKFSYPPTWYSVIGSVQEGDYFFASEPLNFIKELDSGNAVLEVMPYRDLKNMPTADWIKFMEENYLPAGQIQVLPAPKLAGGYETERHTVLLNKPQNPMLKYWDMVTISKGNLHYFFILETDGQKTHDQWVGDFEDILNQVQLYKGFSV